LVNLGLVEEKLGNETVAMEYLEKAVMKVPDSVPANTVLGLIYSRHGKLTEAMARLSLAVALAPRDAQVHNHLGVVLAQRGWRQAAEDEFRRAIELNPVYAEAHFNLALMYLERHPASVELARRHYISAIELGAAPDQQVEAMMAAVRDEDPLEEG
jgi:Flp pilus assembly protein TadD